MIIPDLEKTYCNPTPLPDYPLGRNCFREGWRHRADFRETADPTVLFEDGVWYLYPSCGMVYWSEDYIHWKHKKMEPYDCGYAPTVVNHAGRYLLMASSSQIYASDSPLGDFLPIGYLTSPSGERVLVDDPMLFSDTDGRLYLYSGCGGAIRACELDRDDPCRMLTELAVMFEYDTENHPWERIGDWNEDSSYSWIEGAWMYKRNGIYYLTYCGPGTEWITYSMGAYKGKGPLGPWEYMETSPFLSKRDGLVRGPGHGCITDGPGGTVWAFYTCCMCYGGFTERRIGYDPIGFDENGNIIPTASSEIPQLAPGVLKNPEKGNSAGLLPLTQHRDPVESSCAPGREGIYATDDSMITWWQPAPNDKEPTLTVSFETVRDGFIICSARIIWRDVGLDIKKGYMAGPFKFLIEAMDREGVWHTVADKSANEEDMNIEYITFTPVRAFAVRLRIVGKPENIEPGVTNLTVFGKWCPENL